jgi:hypothetical protein
MTFANRKPTPPSPRQARLRQWLRVATLIVMTALTVAAYYRIVSKGSEHAIDFFSFWRSGQVVWQGLDPYQVALADQLPGIPPLSNENVPIDWRAMPANTAPILLLIAPLARLPWAPAFSLWTIINLGVVILNSLLVVRLLGGRLVSMRGLVILPIFALLVATREVVEYGQTTLLIFTFMLLALLMGPRQPVASGIWLGLALSKISLAFPVFLFFLYRRWFRGLAIGILVQVLGLAVMASISKTSPIDIGLEYLRIILLHSDLPGYHLTSGLLQYAGSFAGPIVLLGSIGLWCLLAVWYRSQRPAAAPYRATAALVLFIIVMQWNLLTFYHRRYDHAVNILFIALVLFWADSPRRVFNLSAMQRRFVNGVTLLCTLVWLLPVYQVLSAYAYIALFNLCSLAALATSVWLLFRLVQPDNEHDPDRS